MTSALDKTVHETVKAMIGEIGKLRSIVAIDNMPDKLQQVRQLLRELDYDLEQRAAITEHYTDRAKSSLANRAK